MIQTNNTMESPAQENLSKLPAECLSVLNTTGEAILIRAGERGYYPIIHQPSILLREGETMDAYADRMNAEDGISKAQRRAMEAGSMFGWEVPAADCEHPSNQEGHHQ